MKKHRSQSEAYSPGATMIYNPVFPPDWVPPSAALIVPSVTGLVVEENGDPDEFASAIVESLTDMDYRDLPDDLRDELRDWCARFSQWAPGKRLERGW